VPSAAIAGPLRQRDKRSESDAIEYWGAGQVAGLPKHSANGLGIDLAESRDAVGGGQQQTPRESGRPPTIELGGIVSY
jgi:hypothetical protein